jgi:hypothetical protein
MYHLFQFHHDPREFKKRVQDQLIPSSDAHSHLAGRTEKFLAIESVLDDADSGLGAPFGRKIAEALEYMLKLGERDGFKTKNVDGYEGHIEYGIKKSEVGFLDRFLTHWLLQNTKKPPPTRWLVSLPGNDLLSQG